MEVLKFIAVATLITLSQNLFAQEQDEYADLPKGQQVHIHLEEGRDYVSAFTKPGQNWKDCDKKFNKETGQQECRYAAGWLDRDSKVWIAGPKVRAPAYDVFTGEEVMEEYYPVQFEYERKGNNPKRGPIVYVDAASLGAKPQESLYDPKKPKKNETRYCSLQKKHVPADQYSEALCELDKKNLENLDSVTAKVKEKIGMCAYPEDDKNKNLNLYDNAILSKLKNVTPPKVKDEENKPMTQEQMIAIDSMARTLYGEMASCYKYGLHYPMAVARIIANRKDESSRHKEFIRGPHEKDKPTIAKVATSPTQFSMWLRKLDGKKNPALERGMCPATKMGQDMWGKQKPSQQEIDVWNKSVKIATEAVMFPATFKKRTDNLEQRYFYTSNVGKFYDMKKEEAVKVDGLPLSRGKCIEVWFEKKKGKKS